MTEQQAKRTLTTSIFFGSWPVGRVHVEGSRERRRGVVNLEQFVREKMTEPLGLVADQRRVVDARLDTQEDGVRRTQSPLHKVLHRLPTHNISRYDVGLSLPDSHLIYG